MAANCAFYLLPAPLSPVAMLSCAVWPRQIFSSVTERRPMPFHAFCSCPRRTLKSVHHLLRSSLLFSACNVTSNATASSSSGGTAQASGVAAQAPPPPSGRLTAQTQGGRSGAAPDFGLWLQVRCCAPAVAVVCEFDLWLQV